MCAAPVELIAEIAQHFIDYKKRLSFSFFFTLFFLGPKKLTMHFSRLVASSSIAVVVLYIFMGSPSIYSPPPRASTWLFFDGVCNLCDGFVNLVAEHDSERRIMFGSIQEHKELLIKHGAGKYALDGDEELKTLILIQEGKFYVRSTAILKTLALMDHPWKSLFIFIYIPVPIRDYLYELIADNRYLIFGKMSNCRAPTENFKRRFLKHHHHQQRAPPLFMNE